MFVWVCLRTACCEYTLAQCGKPQNSCTCYYIIIILCVHVGDELFSDTYPMKVVDDVFYEVEGKVCGSSYLHQTQKLISINHSEWNEVPI